MVWIVTDSDNLQFRKAPEEKDKDKCFTFREFDRVGFPVFFSQIKEQPLEELTNGKYKFVWDNPRFWIEEEIDLTLPAYSKPHWVAEYLAVYGYYFDEEHQMFIPESNQGTTQYAISDDIIAECIFEQEKCKDSMLITN